MHLKSNYLLQLNYVHALNNYVFEYIIIIKSKITTISELNQKITKSKECNSYLENFFKLALQLCDTKLAQLNKQSTILLAFYSGNDEGFMNRSLISLPTKRSALCRSMSGNVLPEWKGYE